MRCGDSLIQGKGQANEEGSLHPLFKPEREPDDGGLRCTVPHCIIQELVFRMCMDSVLCRWKFYILAFGADLADLII